MEAGTQTLSPDALSPRSGAPWRRHPAVRFALHYLEMVAVMFAGMGILGGALLLIAAALGFGVSEIRENAPAAFLAGMGVSMTVPMVWWMRFRGHSWPASTAMGWSMVLPTVATIALLAAGGSDLHGALMIQHVAMFPAMLGAMLLHRDEFTGHDRAG